MPVLICLRRELWTGLISVGDQVPTCPVFTRAKIKSCLGILVNFPVTSVIFRILIGEGVLLLCRDAVGVFNSPSQVLPLWATVDLGVMAMKGCSAFPKALALLKPHHQIVYPGHLLWGVFPLCRDAVMYSTAPADWAIF